MAVMGKRGTMSGNRARRDYGTGSVYQRADGRWVGAISAGWTERGTRRRVSVTADTQAEAKRRLRKKIQDLEAGAIADASGRATVKAWSDQWLPMAERALSPHSMTATRSAVGKWIVPTIGHRRFEQLNPADVRAVLDAQRKAGKSSSTQRRTHSVLMKMLKAAQAEGYPVAPRVLAVEAPQKAVNDRTDVPVDAAARMLMAADDPAAVRWLVAFTQGLRQGEALGLTREQIDLEQNTLTISWQLQPLPYTEKRNRRSGFRIPDGYEARQVRDRWHLVRPKSRAGWRIIPIVPVVRAPLAAWLDVAPPAPQGIVFYHPVGDPPKRDDAAWYALQDAAGVRHPDGRHFTIHEARHATASILLELGVDPVVITAIMGHSSILSSRPYMHTRAAVLVDALERVASRLTLPTAETAAQPTPQPE